MSITNNPFVSTLLKDSNIRILRNSSVTQQVRDDLPLAIQYVKYEEEDFFAVGFNRILKTRITNAFDQIFNLYNVSTSGAGSAVQNAMLDTYYTFSQSASFAHVRDYLYREDVEPDSFVRQGEWINSITGAYLGQWPTSQSGALTGLVAAQSPLWLRNHRDGTSAEVTSDQLSAGPSGITQFVKIMSLKSDYARDEISPGTFQFNVLDTNILTKQNFIDGDTQYVNNPPPALTLSPSFKDTAVAFSHPNAKLDVFSKFAGSGFTLEIIFRPLKIDGRQTLLFKGGALGTISGGLTALTQDIYDAGTTYTYAGAHALSGDNKFMALSANPEGIFFESWEELSGDTLFAGRHLEPQVDFLGNTMAPVFSELRIDLLSSSSFEIQVGDGDLTKVIGTTGLAYGRGGTLEAGSGQRFAFAGASATYVAHANSGGMFNLEDGNVHHLIVAWSPTATSHSYSTEYPAIGSSPARGSYSGHIRAYLDGKKLIPESSISSAQYSVSGLFMIPNDPTMGGMENMIPPVTFDAGDVETVNNYTLPSVPYELLDSQSPAEMKGVIFTDAACQGLAVTACDNTIAAPTYTSIRLFDPLITSVSAQIISPAATVSQGGYKSIAVNQPALTASTRIYTENVITLSGGKALTLDNQYPTGGITGSQFARFEQEDLGFPYTSMEEVTIELFFRTNADRDGNSGSLEASRTGTIFSIGGTNLGGEYSSKQLALEYINDTISSSTITDWPKIRVTLFDGDEQMGENDHELKYFCLNAYPTTSLSASFETDPFRLLPTNQLPVSGWPAGQTMDVTNDNNSVHTPIYRSTPYLALSYSNNDLNARVKSATSLGGFYQIFVEQDIGLSADPGITTGDSEEGKANTLTSLIYYAQIDSNTATQFYSGRSFNFKLPLADLTNPPRTNSSLFLNGIADSLTAAAIGIANSEFCTFEVEEMRIWKKALTKKEMQEHARDRSTLYYTDNSVPALTESDLISQFTFNRTSGPSNLVIGSTPQRSPYHKFTRRRDSMSFPRPNVDINANNFSGEIFELRGWVGALADPFDNINTTGSVILPAGYEVYNTLEDPNSPAEFTPSAATANEIGLCFSRAGTVLKKGHIQRYSQYLENYLPLASPTNYNDRSLTSCIFGNKPYTALSRSPKTNSMLAFWYNFEDSINSKLARDRAQDSNLTLFNESRVNDTGFIQYKDLGKKIINSPLANHAIQRVAKFGTRQLTQLQEQPTVGVIFNTLNTIVWDSSDKFQNGFHEEVNFTDYDQSWANLQEKLLSIEYNNVIYKAMLQPNTTADGPLFNGSQNPTAYDPVTNEYFSLPPATYITAIGFYNDTNELLAVANVDKPLRKNEDQTIVFKPLLDFSPDDQIGGIIPSLSDTYNQSSSVDGGGSIENNGDQGQGE